MHKLNKNQQKAVEYVASPLLIVAGAGTGKTTVITEKISYLIENGLDKAEEILAVTFTEKATAEMQTRVEELLPLGGFDISITTFHGLAETILQTHALDIGLSNNFKLLNEAETWMLIRQHLDKFNLDYYRPLGNPAKFIHALIKHFQKCKDELISPENYLEYASSLILDKDLPQDQTDEAVLEIKKINELANAYHIYNQLLLGNNAMDFADLIFYTVKLLRERPNILRFYKNRYKYLLVDEFQDTNWSQYELIKLLSQNGGAHLTAVGDDDQSIYKFRGASVSNILQFKTDYPNSQEIVLNENYRSGQGILDLAYNFIQLNNPDRLEANLKIDKKLLSQNKIKTDADLLYGHTERDEARLVVKKILALKKDNPNLLYSDFAILCRANNYALQFIAELATQGVSYDFKATSGLFRQKVILDSLAFLRLCDNYHESPAVYRVITMPIFAISPEDIGKLLLHAKREAVSLFEALKLSQNGLVKLSEAGQVSVEKLLTLIAECSELAKTAPVGKVLYTFWEKSTYLKMLSDNADKYYQDIFYLQSLFEKIEEFQKNNVETNVHSWLNYFDYILESGDSGEEKNLDKPDDGVRIMSIHAAKGLEFDYVFVPNLVDQRFPTVNRSTDIDIPDALVRESTLPTGDSHTQEERRLLYVAITRAKQGIYFTAAKDYGGVREKKLSKFIFELETSNAMNFSRETNQLKQDITTPQVQEVKVPTKTILPTPTEFSFSQLQAYEKCPWQYRFQFVLKIPTFGKGVFSFGKTMHSTLQKFYQKMIEQSTTKLTVPPKEDLLELYRASWEDSWFNSADQKQDYKKTGLEILNNFYDLGEKNGWNVPISLEAGFRFKLAGNTIKGQIDRIDRLVDGKIAIIDYKTGQPKEKIKAEDKRQLLIYQIASESVLELRDLGEVEELTYYFLNNNTTQSFKGTDIEIEKEKEKITATITEIKKGNFEANPSRENCQFCDFKDICDFRV